jgi:signal-transduction protein with cAMP-binding, CBS, and nucleotidyltransferase domain
MKVGEIILEQKSPLHAVPAVLTVAGAAKKMRSKNVGAMIVKQGAEYVGIITERDVARCMAESDNPRAAKVNEYMSKDIYFVEPDDTMIYAAQVMQKEGIRYVIVWDGESILHVLSLRDAAFMCLEGVTSNLVATKLLSSVYGKAL